MDKQLDLLNLRISQMVQSAYPEQVQNLVFGEGRLNSVIMLVGEAPGAQETLQHRPFVGKAGQNLDAFIRAVDLNREEMYVTNTVKFRPTRQSPKGTLSNRPPSAGEIRSFLPFLQEEIAIVQPRVLVTLGNVPLRAVTLENISIGNVHGQFRPLQNCILFPMFHPASVIYNPSLKQTLENDSLTLAKFIKEMR